MIKQQKYSATHTLFSNKTVVDVISYLLQQLASFFIGCKKESVSNRCQVSCR